MRLLFIDLKLPHLLRDREYPIGGAAIELQNWLSGLLAAGHQAGVLTTRSPRGERQLRAPFTILETYERNAGIRIARYFYAHLPSLLSAARSFAPDVVVQTCAGLETGTMAFIAARLKVPFVYRVASDSDVDGRADQKLRMPERSAYRFGLSRAAVIVCQNHYQLAQVQKSYPHKTACVLPNPFLIPSPPPALRSRDQRDYVAWLGVFKAPKNLLLLADVARQIPDLRFKIAGTPARRLDSRTAAGLAALRLLPNVDLVGYVKRTEVLDFLGGAIALLNTSDYEGFSNTYLESFCVGTPVVTRASVDPDSIVARNGLGGVAGSAGDLVRALREVVFRDSERFDALARRCQAYVRTRHDPVELARSMVGALTPFVHVGSAQPMAQNADT